jgi:hypothetical protein
MEKDNISTQDWIPIEKIFNNGIIKLKNNKFIKIMKVIPINFNLKSNFEKEAILNSYKIFLKTCNFNIQIFIQSSKENLNKNIEHIQKNLKKEDKQFLNEIAEDYFEFIQKFNSIKNSSTKNFYIIISNYNEDSEEIIFQELNEKYFKIKECLFRCGNSVQDLDKKEAKELFNINLNSRIYLK